MNVLILSPHTDDAEIGMGGTMARLVEDGHRLKHVVFSLCSENIPGGFGDDATLREFEASSTMLGIDFEVFDFKVRRFSDNRQDILDALIKLRKSFTPDIVFIPSHNDIHQDHSVVHSEALRAFKHSSIYGYEMIWNNMADAPNCFVSLNYGHITIKNEIVAQYKSQQHRRYTNGFFLESMADVRGLQCGCDYAEGFYTYRQIWK
jgi:LmbE family N-acetylglucosaminyl deacetylase